MRLYYRRIISIYFHKLRENMNKNKKFDPTYLLRFIFGLFIFYILIYITIYFNAFEILDEYNSATTDFWTQVLKYSPILLWSAYIYFDFTPKFFVIIILIICLFLYISISPHDIVFEGSRESVISYTEKSIIAMFIASVILDKFGRKLICKLQAN